MECGVTMVKYILFILNLLCVLGGIAILTLGIVFYLKINAIEDVFQNINVIVVPVAFIIFGSMILMISFFGCCGAIKDSYFMMLTYSFFLMALLIVQIILGVIVFVNDDVVQKVTFETLSSMWDAREKPAYTELWDAMQSGLECCGLKSALDYQSDTTPVSCCSMDIVFCTTANAFSRGCGPALKDFTQHTGHVFGFIALGVAGIEFIGFIFACCLANDIRKERRK